MKLTAYKNRSGTVTIPIEYDPNGGTNFIPMPLGSTVVEFKVDGDTIDSTGPDVQIFSNEVTVRFGSFDVAENLHDMLLIVYNADYPLGKILAGPGKDNSIELDYRVE